MPDAALLVMDFQEGVVERVVERAGPLLGTLAGATAAARQAGVLVVYVRVGFRAGSPEISPRNRLFVARAGAGTMDEAGPGTQIHAVVAPQPGDVVVTKRRVSAFTGSDLDVVLRSQGVESLVLAGIATSGVVLSTLREAADRDFDLTVLRDGCADTDPEVHRVLLEKVFPRQAAVLDTDEWVRGLGAGGGPG